MRYFLAAFLGLSSTVGLPAAPPEPASFDLTGHTGLIAFVGFSPDSRVLTTVDEAGAVRRWDARTGKLLFERTDPPLRLEHPRLKPEEVLMFAPGRSFTPDGSAVAWVTAKGVARMRDLTTGKEREYRPDDGLAFHGVALSGDGKVLATAAAGVRPGRRRGGPVEAVTGAGVTGPAGGDP